MKLLIVDPVLLLARIHVLSRRTYLELAKHPSPILSIGPFRIDVLSSEVSINEKDIHLSLTEGKLLLLLATHVNTVCTVSLIASYIWGSGNNKAISLVKVYIRRLCKKIEPNPNLPRYILTVSGVGYILSVPSYPS